MRRFGGEMIRHRSAWAVCRLLRVPHPWGFGELGGAGFLCCLADLNQLNHLVYREHVRFLRVAGSRDFNPGSPECSGRLDVRKLHPSQFTAALGIRAIGLLRQRQENNPNEMSSDPVLGCEGIDPWMGLLRDLL